MIFEFLRFELSMQRRSALYWIVAAAMGLLAFAAASSDAVTIGGAVGNVLRNSPLVTINWLAILSLLGMFVIVMFIATPLLRDAEIGSSEMLFSKPFQQRDLVIGRFVAGIIMSMGIYTICAIAIFVATFMPWLDSARLGPMRLDAYVWALLVYSLPNTLLIGGILAALAVRFRSVMAVYIGVLAVLVGFIVASTFLRELDTEWIVALSDPFGIRALRTVTRYWTAAERNADLPTLIGYLGANRLLWMGVAVGLLTYAVRAFDPFAKRSLAGKQNVEAAPVSAPKRLQQVLPKPSFGAASTWAAFWSGMKLHTRWVVFGVPFIVMLLFALINFYAAARGVSDLYGTTVYPVSYLMVDAIQGGMQWLLVIIVTFYAGELIWRERSAKMHEIVDASPIGNLLPLMAKTSALVAVIVIFGLASILTAMVYQLIKGYTLLEPGVYLSGVAINSLFYLTLGLFAIAIQVITGNKFLGYGIVLAALMGQIALGALNLNHNLYQLGGAPPSTYSDMNRWGPFLTATLSFSAYWLAFCGALLALAAAYLTRGVAGSFAQRTRLALTRLKGPLGIGFAVSAAAFVGIGGFIFYNTNVLNTYLASDTQLDQQAAYEREYKKLSALKQPRITKVYADVDISPKLGRALIRGRYTLVNQSGAPINTLVVQMNPDAKLNSLTLPAHTVRKLDKDANLRIIDLAQPLAVDESIEIRFESELGQQGFRNGRQQTEVVENGTFFNNRSAFPSFGYQPRFEIDDRNERRKRDLGEPRRMPPLEDEAARANTYIGNDADWIDFETVVSTDEDQIALSPGYLKREWVKDGRRYFHYKMDAPMLAFFAYLSARWEVTRGEWNGLPIEVYHDPKHGKNVQRMIESTRDSLDYFSKNFSKYQHRQVRIIEFPRYASFAQSFANTIPYSESIGFIADLRDPASIDYVYYVTAHEVAHQWWAHQVIGADVQGSTMMSESLAQYSALMVMEKKYGPNMMRKFLRYELDTYLLGRGTELLQELPLYRVENQPYVHYRKGALVFYRLKDEIGETALNAALAEYIKNVAFQRAPFTTSRELIALIRQHAPPEKQQLITDLFEKITLYDNRVESASVEKRADGKFDVTLKLKAGKMYVDGKGVEAEAGIDDDIDVGIFSGEGEKQKVLYLKKHRINSANPQFTLTVAEQPSEVGFDPYNKLIDRVSRDNRKKL